MWSLIDGKGSLSKQKWLEYDKAYLKDRTTTIVLQINGRVRSHLEIEGEINEKKVKDLALQDARIQHHIKDKGIKKIIYVPNKILNIVV